MNLSPHFTLDEFTNSDTALRLGIVNELPSVLIEVARSTAQMMERIRAHLGYIKAYDVGIDVTSGYRCPGLNAAIGSHGTSDHLRMLAIDFRAPKFGTPLAVCKALVPVMGHLGIGQLIYEHTWVHVSSRDPDKAINRVITVQGKGYAPGVVEA